MAARQGEVIDPLQYMCLLADGIWLNGDDRQVAWMKRQTPRPRRVK